MEVNSDKCKVMHFEMTIAGRIYIYKINGRDLVSIKKQRGLSAHRRIHEDSSKGRLCGEKCRGDIPSLAGM